MFKRCHWPALALLVAAAGLVCVEAQEGLPPVPKGVEVLGRGPLHEAFASLTADPVPAKPVAKKPPEPIDEMPPAEKPAGNVIWISGYWAFDDERNDFLWVSGLWRTVPPGKQWVPGYWREDKDGWLWVAGFWGAAAKTEEQEVTYLPSEPPKAPAVAPPGQAPTPDSFYVPGVWLWNEGCGAYAWRAGYWARSQPGYVWVADHYRWTPSGYIYIPGYWDLAVKDRGLVYAPVYITPGVVTVGFTYTPAYAVRDTVVVGALFVRPVTCSYYFGDYYAVGYRNYGFESCVVYSQRCYDPIIVYERRADPTWFSLQVNLYNGRCAGTVPCPPQTIVNSSGTVINNTNVVNQTIVNNNVMVASNTTVIQNKNIRTVNIDNSTRLQARAQAQAVQAVARQRSVNEVARAPGDRTPMKRAMSAVKTQPVTPGFVAPKPPPHTPPAPKAHANTGAVRSPANPVRPVTPVTRPPVTPITRPRQPVTRTPPPVTRTPPPVTRTPPPRRPPPKDKDKK